MVKVIEPLCTIELTYDWENNDGRLAYVKTFWPYYHGLEVKQIHKLYYGDYLNSKNKIDSVLIKVRQTTEFKELEEVHVFRDCPVCPIYDELDEEQKRMQANNVENNYFLP